MKIELVIKNKLHKFTKIERIKNNSMKKCKTKFFVIKKLCFAMSINNNNKNG